MPRAATPTSQPLGTEQAQPPGAEQAQPPDAEQAQPPDAAPPARAARTVPPPQPPPPDPAPPEEEAADPYAGLDPDAARRLVDALSKQLNRARSDNPLARELYDELTTLKRTLYAENPKRAWLAGSLKSILRILEEATSHSVGTEMRAAEHLAAVERILKL